MVRILSVLANDHRIIGVLKTDEGLNPTRTTFCFAMQEPLWSQLPSIFRTTATTLVVGDLDSKYTSLAFKMAEYSLPHCSKLLNSHLAATKCDSPSQLGR